MVAEETQSSLSIFLVQRTGFTGRHAEWIQGSLERRLGLANRFPPFMPGESPQPLVPFWYSLRCKGANSAMPFASRSTPSVTTASISTKPAVKPPSYPSASSAHPLQINNPQSTILNRQSSSLPPPCGRNIRGNGLHHHGATFHFSQPVIGWFRISSSTVQKLLRPSVTWRTFCTASGVMGS